MALRAPRFDSIRASIVVSALWALAACSDRAPKTAGAIDLRGAGATFPYPLYRAWFSEYGSKAGVRINYYSVGSSEGLRLLDRGEADFGAVDSPVSPVGHAAGDACARVAIPTVMGPIAIAYNLPTIPANRAVVLDAPALASIFTGRISMWDAAPLVALNPTLSLPHAQIVVVHRAAGSGTSQAFSDFLRGNQRREFPAADSEMPLTVGVSAEGNEGIASEVKVTVGAIGYLQLSYARENRLAFAAIRTASGSVVLPGDTTQAYPISTRTWLVIDPARLASDKARPLADFIQWALRDGATIAHDYEYRAVEPDTVAYYEQRLKETDFKSCHRP